MFPTLSRAPILATGLLIVAGFSQASAEEATLAAGAGFRKPLSELAAAYEAGFVFLLLRRSARPVLN